MRTIEVIAAIQEPKVALAYYNQAPRYLHPKAWTGKALRVFVGDFIPFLHTAAYIAGGD
jgi:hypothetical protein